MGQVRKSLSEKANTGQGGRVDKRYDLGADEVIRYDDGKGRKLPAIPDSMVADIIALVHDAWSCWNWGNLIAAA